MAYCGECCGAHSWTQRPLLPCGCSGCRSLKSFAVVLFLTRVVSSPASAPLTTRMAPQQISVTVSQHEHALLVMALTPNWGKLRLLALLAHSLLPGRQCTCLSLPCAYVLLSALMCVLSTFRAVHPRPCEKQLSWLEHMAWV